MIKSNFREKRNTSVHLENERGKRINLRGNHFYLYTQQERKQKKQEKYLYIKCNDVRRKTKDIVEERQTKTLFGKEAKFY